MKHFLKHLWIDGDDAATTARPFRGTLGRHEETGNFVNCFRN